jgi:hypothetical protein
MEMATRTLLRVDSGGGLTAGVLVLLFRRELSAIENLPEVLLLFTGAVNVGYGLYSGSLLRGVPAAGALRALVVMASARERVRDAVLEIALPPLAAALARSRRSLAK